MTLEVAAAFQQIPRDALGDPWDRFISATAMALDLPLVTHDQQITDSTWSRPSGISAGSA